MKKFENILFCTDLDGTLLSSDKTISKQNLDAIEYFKSERGKFTFITGRDPLMSRYTCDVIKPNAPFGCFNGSAIYDNSADKYLWSAFLENDFIELVEYVDKVLPDIAFMLFTKENVLFCKDNSASEYFKKTRNLSNTICDFHNVKEPVLKIVFAHENEERLLKLKEMLKNHPKSVDFEFNRSEYIFYEMLAKGINKGAALKQLAKLLNISMSKTIAVGDYNNDISMIKSAKLGFSTANAREEVKAVSDIVTVSNDENAIAAIIDGLDSGKFVL